MIRSAKIDIKEHGAEENLKKGAWSKKKIREQGLTASSSSVRGGTSRSVQ